MLSLETIKKLKKLKVGNLSKDVSLDIKIEGLIFIYDLFKKGQLVLKTKSGNLLGNKQ